MVAKGIVSCHMENINPSRFFVQDALGKEYGKWVNHPDYGPIYAFPESCWETLAMDILPLYRNKQIKATIGEAWSRLHTHPHEALVVAQQLKNRLEAWI